MIGRFRAFVAVGAVGLLVQMAVFLLLSRTFRLPVALATAIAVEAAVLHNFVWHERWTWRGRIAGLPGALLRLARFNLSTGAASIAGNVLIVSVLVNSLGVDGPAAALLAVVSMCAVNFVLADRWVFRAALILPAIAVLGPSPVAAAEPTADALAAWGRYVARVEADVSRRGTAAVDAAVVRAVLGGATIVERTRMSDDAEHVPSGTIQHWRGAVFVPGIALDTLLGRLEEEPPVQDGIVRSRILTRVPGRVRVYARLVRQCVITVTYDTEHETTFDRRGLPRVAASRTVMTRIAEIGHPGTPRERPLAADEQHGFMWRLHSYARYTAMQGGVVVEIESVSLGRDVPWLVRTVAWPIVNRIARESMQATLEAMRRRGGREG